ncbi:MAG: NAD-binding protein [Anaerolineales bacterium]|nr:NAD-binding protein [Anaerolineales bacterium]
MLGEDKVRVAFLGTGLMGLPMASRLIEAGYPLTVYNRTRQKAEPLRLKGAEVVEDPAQAVRSATCVIVMLTDSEAVSQVLLAPHVQVELPGRVVVQMGTIAPDESVELAARFRTLGSDYFEAPVMGGPSHAREGSLITLVGAEPDLWERWSHIFMPFSAHVRHIGPVGKAAVLKLALNHLIASLTATFAFSLGLVVKHEVSVELFMELSRLTGLFATPFESKLPRMLDRNYQAPNYPVRLVLKDVDLMIEEADRLGINRTVVNSVKDILTSVVAAGWSEGDYSAMYEVIAPATN